MNRSLGTLYLAAAAGTAEIARHSALLDRINVFPVMDGDTGTNMAATTAVLSEVGEPPEPPETIVSRLLRAAVGNSGIIAGQFIAGFLASAACAPSCERKYMAEAAAAGRDRAYAAVAKPREGTMLTAMRALAASLAESDAPLDAACHAAICARLLETVVRTQQMLPKLKEAKVVDAGALGFYLFAYPLLLAGVAEIEKAAAHRIAAICRGEERVPIDGIHGVIAPTYLESVHAERERRYCINLLVETDDPRDPSTLFADLGDSANTARDGRLLKIHIHADDVAPVKKRAGRMGTLVDLQVQDMHAAVLSRIETSRSTVAHKKIRVVTDSGASLDRGLAESCGILRVDNRVHVYGRAVPDRDINVDELYLGMRSGQVFKTAQVSPTDATAFLEEAAAVSDRLLYIGVGSAYTGTQSCVRAAAASLEIPVRCLDSRAASGQLGLICLATQQFADRTERFEDVVAYAERQIETCEEYLLIDDLKYLAAGGRIGRITAGFASLLSLKPIVGHGEDGAITHAKVRSTEAAIKEISARIAAHPGKGALLLMVEYTDNRPFAESLRARLLAALPPETEIVLSPLSSTSAVHMGPGTFGVAVTRV